MEKRREVTFLFGNFGFQTKQSNFLQTFVTFLFLPCTLGVPWTHIVITRSFTVTSGYFKTQAPQISPTPSDFRFQRSETRAARWLANRFVNTKGWRFPGKFLQTRKAKASGSILRRLYAMEVSEAINKGHNVLVLGQAGTDKSKLLSKTYEMLKIQHKNVQALATTGIASSILPNGRTVHSFFWSTRWTLYNDSVATESWQWWQYILKIEVVLIDEISMMSKKTLEQIDDLCRHVRSCDQPFGGIQLILFGDLFQLRPVPNHVYDDHGEHFVESQRYVDKFHVFKLTDVHRQTEGLNMRQFYVWSKEPYFAGSITFRRILP